MYLLRKKTVRFPLSHIKKIPMPTKRRLKQQLLLLSEKKISFLSTKIGQDLSLTYPLTLPYHPWTNRQVERMNRTITETTKKHCYKDHPILRKASRSSLHLCITQEPFFINKQLLHLCHGEEKADSDRSSRSTFPF